MKRLIFAWVKKYIFGIHSPIGHLNGYEFEYDYLKTKNKRGKKNER